MDAHTEPTEARNLTGKRVERALQLDRAAINEEARTATVSFASEIEYDRGWGVEILDVSQTSICLNYNYHLEVVV